MNTPRSLSTGGTTYNAARVVGQGRWQGWPDENPERVALIQRVTLAYLRHALGIDDTDWAEARNGTAMGRLESK